MLLFFSTLLFTGPTSTTLFPILSKLIVLVLFFEDLTDNSNIWTHGSKIMRFLSFQPKLGHAVNQCQYSRICPNVPKTTQNYQNLTKSAQRQLARGTFKCHQNLRFYCFSKIIISMCRGSTRVCVQRLDF
jgi:hypothetical protein